MKNYTPAFTDRYILNFKLINKTVLVILLNLFIFISFSKAETFSGGSGTSSDPYQIATASDLALLTNSPNYWNSGIYFVQVNNIDLTAYLAYGGQGYTNWGIKGWLPIGNSSVKFSGNYNGNYFTITGLTINDAAGYNGADGLFGYVSASGIISNLGIVINGSVAGVSNVGGLAGENLGTISNCYSSGTVSGSGNYAGELVGNNSGTINNCYSAGNVSATGYCGGLVGIGSGNITNCYSMASVNGISGKYFFGGLVGEQNGGTISDCFAAGSVAGGDSTGGLIGSEQSSTIINSYWDINTTGQTKSSGSASSYGETSANMKTQATFIGWDFATPVWYINPADNNGYPYLAIQQYILFSAIPSQTYGNNPLTLSASGGASGNAVMFTSSDNTTATCTGTNGTTLTIIKPGSVNIYANQAQGTSQFAAPQVSQTLVVSRKTLTVTGAIANDKVYDGSTSASISGGSLVGIVGTDTVFIATPSSGTFASDNAGKGIAVTASLTLSGPQAGNYILTQPSLSADITPKTLTVTGAAVLNKVYDGTTTATITGGSLSGVIGSDDVEISTPAGSFASANSGNNIPVTAALTLSGSSAGNYTLTQPSPLSADITPKTLTVTGMTAENKVYDGTTIATLFGGTLSGVIGSDNVYLLNALTGTFASPGAGNGIAVATSLSLSGASAGNYTLTQPAYLSAAITPKSLMVTGAAADNKVYDGTTAATISGSTLSGIVGSDIVTIGSNAGTFATANVGDGISVTADLTLTGIASGNYVIVQPTGLASDITPGTLTVTGASAENKVYDGTTAATITGGTLAGVIGSDVVNIANQTGTFASANVGNGIAVTASLTLSGTSAGNYTLTQPASLTADISPRTLSVTGAAAQNKVYDGTTTAVITGGSLLGVVGLDEVVIATSTGNFASADAGTGIAVTGDLTLSGSSADNYVISQPSSLTANITPKTLTLTSAVADNKTYDGTATDTISIGYLTGVLGTDDVDIVNPTGTFASANVGTGIAVTPDLVLSGSSAGNYSLTQPSSLSANISPKELTVSRTTAENKIYDGNTAAIISGGILNGIVGTDEVNIATPIGIFSSPGVGKDIPVTAELTLSGTSASNYTLVEPSSLSANITPKTLNVTGATADSKIYDGTTTATINIVGSSLTGVLLTDTVYLGNNGTGEFATANIGKDIPVTGELTITGASSKNYILAQPELSAEIYPRPLTITAKAESKVKGTADPVLKYAISGDGLAGNDSIKGSLTRQPGDTVGKYNIEIGTLSAGPNYSITFISAVFTIVTSTGTSADEENNLSMYPNPASDFIYLKNVPENTTISVLNMNGVLLKNYNATGTTEIININDLSSGIYILKLTGLKLNTVMRFIKL